MIENKVDKETIRELITSIRESVKDTKELLKEIIRLLKTPLETN